MSLAVWGVSFGCISPCTLSLYKIFQHAPTWLGTPTCSHIHTHTHTYDNNQTAKIHSFETSGFPVQDKINAEMYGRHRKMRATEGKQHHYIRILNPLPGTLEFVLVAFFEKGHGMWDNRTSHSLQGVEQNIQQAVDHISIYKCAFSMQLLHAAEEAIETSLTRGTRLPCAQVLCLVVVKHRKFLAEGHGDK